MSVANSDAAPLIVLVAGEASGDNLGAQLITALRQRIPQARFAGIAGSRMVAAGCEALGAHGKPVGDGAVRNHSPSAAAADAFAGN